MAISISDTGVIKEPAFDKYLSDLEAEVKRLRAENELLKAVLQDHTEWTPSTVSK